MKTAAFRDRIGLVAIDDAHLIRQWGIGFRPEFMAIGELRILLPKEVVWFACTATASAETQHVIQTKAGFRSIGDGPYQSQLIRTSTDRPNVSLVVLAIKRHMGGTGKSGYPLLYFLLKKSVDANGLPTPQFIPKTVIFIDGRRKIRNCVNFLRKMLVQKTSNVQAGLQYGTDVEDARHCVFNVVEEFTSHVAAFDQKARYEEFIKPDSKIRIMVATTLLGTGINISDVEQAVIWDIPLDPSIEELWQRIGRIGRAPSLQGTAYIFLPYWLFDSEGVERPTKEIVVPAPTPVQQSGARKTRGRRTVQVQQSNLQSRNFQPSQSSRLRYAPTPGDASDVESLASSRTSNADSVAGLLDDEDNSYAVDGRPYWNEREVLWRAAVDKVWLWLPNCGCKRVPILNNIGESELPPGVQTEKPRFCCDWPGHGLSWLTPDLELPPKDDSEQTISRPKAGSRAWFALERIDEWAIRCAEEIFCTDESRFRMPAAAFMSDEVRWRLTTFYSTSNRFVLRLTTSFSDLCEHITQLRDWEYGPGFGASLPVFLHSIIVSVDMAYNAYTAEQKAKQLAKRAAESEQMVQQTPTIGRSVADQTLSETVLASRVATDYSIRSISSRLTPELRKWADGLRDPLAPPTPPPPNAAPELVRLFDTIIGARVLRSESGEAPIPVHIDSHNRVADVVEPTPSRKRTRSSTQ
jgi:hypothetical protein